MKKLALLFLSVLLTSNVFAIGGDCSSAILQVENQLETPLTFSGFSSSSGNSTVITNTGAAGTSGNYINTHIVNVNGPGDSAEIALHYNSITAEDGSCTISGLQMNLQRSADHNSCKIVSHNNPTISGDCEIGFHTEGGSVSYPTLVVAEKPFS